LLEIEPGIVQGFLQITLMIAVVGDDEKFFLAGDDPGQFQADLFHLEQAGGPVAVGVGPGEHYPALGLPLGGQATIPG
jgi:hypothetical protein